MRVQLESWVLEDIWNYSCSAISVFLTIGVDDITTTCCHRMEIILETSVLVHHQGPHRGCTNLWPPSQSHLRRVRFNQRTSPTWNFIDFSYQICTSRKSRPREQFKA